MRKILITGGAGYLGNIISSLALRSGFSVKVLDALWFKKEVPLFFMSDPNYKFIKGDISDEKTVADAMDDVDFVVHAAAVVGEPASKKYPELTRKINYEASINLIDQACRSGVRGVIFLSTCSNYGVSEGIANEETPLNPLSLYAETKVNVEKYLTGGKADIDWVICRLSTLYGISTRMRFDLTVNDFALNAYSDRYLEIFLPYTHRPYIHVQDAAGIILSVIRDFDKVKNNVFNIGFNDENYQKIQVADIVKEYLPDLEIKVVSSGSDVRDYKVDFSKAAKYLNVKKTRTLADGVKEVLEMLKTGLVTDPRSAEYYNTSPNFGR